MAETTDLDVESQNWRRCGRPRNQFDSVENSLSDYVSRSGLAVISPSSSCPEIGLRR